MKTRRPIFSALGSIQERDGRRAFVPKSSAYLRDRLSKLAIGATVSVTFEEDVYTRSEAQLALFFVYATYAAEASGFTKDEMYDVLIKECFGAEMKEWRGRTYEVRRSISNAAKMSTADMSLLVEHAKSACDFLGLSVPTAEELGYISNTPHHFMPRKCLTVANGLTMKNKKVDKENGLHLYFRECVKGLRAHIAQRAEA